MPNQDQVPDLDTEKDRESGPHDWARRAADGEYEQEDPGSGECGDLQIIGETLHVRLDPASAPRRSKALAALCDQLTQTQTQTRYPGTDLVVAYSVKGHPQRS